MKAVLAESEDAAVIDVGSNSVRLVVYRIDGRAMTPTLNEKVMAGLGRDLPRTGELAKEGVEAALRALRRFAALLDALAVRSVFAVATAAVREAADGQRFVERVRTETGFDLRVLSGAEEAQLSALGVAAGAPDAKGVVGDLGGSSLELIEVGVKRPDAGETFSVGPLALARGEFDHEKVSAEVSSLLKASKLLPKRGGHFYAVGGAWRAIGRIDMALRDHPLGVLHYHEMSANDALKVADLVRKQSRRSLEKLEYAAAKRADTLPYAAVVLEQVLHQGQFERVILSALGLREGVLIERMSQEALATDPLIAAAEALIGRSTRSRSFGEALEAWIEPMFVQANSVFPERREKLLRGAAARLADIGGLLHPDQRVEVMFDLILRAPLAAIRHSERAFLAAAIHHRYSKTPPRHAAAYARLLNEDRQAAAGVLGAALRLGADLSGRSKELLDAFSLDVADDVLTLKVRKGFAHLVTETAQRRLDYAAAALGVRAQIKAP